MEPADYWKPLRMSSSLALPISQFCDAACLADTACYMSRARVSTCPERQLTCVTGSSWCRIIFPFGQPRGRRLAAGSLSGMRMHSSTRPRHAPQSICQFLLQKKALINTKTEQDMHAATSIPESDAYHYLAADARQPYLRSQCCDSAHERVLSSKASLCRMGLMTWSSCMLAAFQSS